MPLFILRIARFDFAGRDSLLLHPRSLGLTDIQFSVPVPRQLFLLFGFGPLESVTRVPPGDRSLLLARSPDLTCA